MGKYIVHIDGVRLCLRTAATIVLIYPAGYMSMKNGCGMILSGEKREGEVPVPVLLCQPQILHGLTWAFTVRGQRLTT
jgi:hypothetical protein